MGRQYYVSVDEHEGIFGEDSEDGLFLLIEQRTGIPRAGAEPILAKGVMIVSNELVVSRQDLFQALLAAAKQRLPPNSPPTPPAAKRRCSCGRYGEIYAKKIGHTCAQKAPGRSMMIKGPVDFPFNEAKATEAATYLLQLNNSPMSSLKLIKLLYLVDRSALLQFGRPVTTDRYVLTREGPSLSRVEGLLTAGSPVWNAFISEGQGQDLEVSLRRAFVFSELSSAELELIESVFSNCGKQTASELVEHAKRLPEWKDPQAAKIPLEYPDILLAGGMPRLQVAAIVDELESLAAMIKMLK